MPKDHLGCCVEDTYRVIRGVGNSLYAKSHSRECALPIKSPGYATGSHSEQNGQCSDHFSKKRKPVSVFAASCSMKYLKL